MKRVILQAYSSDEDSSFDFDYCAIELEPTYMETLITRAEFAQQQSRQDPDFDHIAYIDYDPVWFADPWDVDDSGPREFGRAWDRFRREGWLLEPETHYMREYVPLGRTCDDTVVFRSDGSVWWRCRPRDTGVEITTARLSLDVLRDLHNEVLGTKE